MKHQFFLVKKWEIQIIVFMITLTRTLKRIFTPMRYTGYYVVLLHAIDYSYTPLYVIYHILYILSAWRNYFKWCAKSQSNPWKRWYSHHFLKFLSSLPPMQGYWKFGVHPLSCLDKSYIRCPRNWRFSA